MRSSGEPGGAAGGLWRRVLPLRLGSLRRTLAQHPRRVVDVDRRARRLAGDRGALGAASARSSRTRTASACSLLRCSRRASHLRPGGDRRDACVRHRGDRRGPACRHVQRAPRDPVRPVRRRRLPHARDPADAVGRHLCDRDAATLVQHALQHLERAAPARAAQDTRRRPVYAAVDLGRALLAERDEDVAEPVPQRSRGHGACDGSSTRSAARRGARDPVPRLRPAAAPALTRPLGRVHLAGDYLGTWYTETAAQTAEQAASAVRSHMRIARGPRHRDQLAGVSVPRVSTSSVSAGLDGTLSETAWILSRTRVTCVA